jgi:amino acid transporter
MFEQLLGQGWFGCSIVGTSNPFCPEDVANIGMPLLMVLLVAAAGLALFKAWDASRRSKSEKKRVTRILATTAVLAATYVSIAFVPLVYSSQYSLLVMAALGAVATMAVYRAHKRKKQQASFGGSNVARGN